MTEHWEPRTVQTEKGAVKLMGLPPLREQQSLNGLWEEGGEVPVYAGSPIPARTYRRSLAIPASWAGKVIRLAFLGVNDICDVYVDEAFAGRHVGAWVPFDVDITPFVRPGQTHALRVEVKGPLNPPILDENGLVQMPTGRGAMDSRNTGIVDDVWLRAYGDVHILDAQIETSQRKDAMDVTYTLCNTRDVCAAVTLRGTISQAEDGFVVKTFERGVIKLLPGERKQVKVSLDWHGYRLWWPDQPFLYHLRTELALADTVADWEQRRFGFREIWIEGNQYKLNGVRVNLYGSYDSFGVDWYVPTTEMTPELYPNMVVKQKDLNIRINRWHTRPPAQYVLDINDEMGMLTHLESILYARGFMKHADKERLFESTRAWIAEWVVANRNHPSVIKWGACNEMTYSSMTGEYDKRRLIGSLEDAILQHDATRPVNFDGEADVGRSTVDHHYLEGYNTEPQGSIYSWARYVHPGKPTGMGEVLHTKSPDQRPQLQRALQRSTWWLGVWIRGMRYVGFTDVRPAWYWFARNELDSERSRLLRCAFAPVALFDKAYDDLGIAPYVDGQLPAAYAGDTLERTLVAYNDDYRDEIVDLRVLVQVDGRTLYAGKKTVNLPLGEHLELPYMVKVPDSPGKRMGLTLIAQKRGVKRFEETKWFEIVENPYRPAQEGGVSIQASKE